MTDTMTLTYALDQKLLLKGMTYAGTAVWKGQKRKRVWPRYLGMFVAALIAQLGLGFFEGAFGWHFSWDGFVVGMGLTALVGFALQRRAMRVLSETACEAIMRRGPVQMTISRAGLSERSGVGRMEVGWPAVDDIAELDGGIVVRIGAMCMVIADSGLPDGMDRRALANKLKAMLEADTVFG